MRTAVGSHTASYGMPLTVIKKYRRIFSKAGLGEDGGPPLRLGCQAWNRGVRCSGIAGVMTLER